MPYCSREFPMLLRIAWDNAPFRPEITSSWVVLLMTFLVELYTMASRRLSAPEMEPFRVWANFTGSVMCQRI